MLVRALPLWAALYFGVSIGEVSLAGNRQESFHLYEIGPKGVAAAALAPQGPQVAVLKHADIQRGASGYWDGAYDDLEIWDFHAQKLLLERRKLWQVNSGEGNKRLQWEAGFPRSLAYTPDGRKLIFSDGKVLYVFDITDYHEVRRFPFTFTKLEDHEGEAVCIRVSPNGEEIAVRLRELRWNGKTFESAGPLLLQVYSLESGHLEREWKFENSVNSWDRGLSWSTDGIYLVTDLISSEQAVGASVIPTGFADLRVVNVKTGQLSTEINTSSPSLITDVAFIGNGTVVTAGGKDSLRLWDAKAGMMVREIPSTPNGVHYHVQVSSDGQVVLGYVGKDRVIESYVKSVEQRFRLWDGGTWNVLFTSPPIHWPPGAEGQDSSIFAAEELRFALSPNGKIVMVWRQDIKAPIYVYEVK